MVIKTQFHSFMKSRYRHNNIVGLNQGEVIIDDVEGVKQMAFDHFQERFQKKFYSRPLLEGIVFNDLSYDKRASLEALYSMQDIKEVIWNVASGKNLCPYGFSMEFYKVC